MTTELIVAGAALLALVFLSTVESAYESLSEVSLRVMVGDREESSRARFFRELLEKRRLFELILILGTQLSIAVIAILAFSIVSGTGVRAPLAITLVIVFFVVVIFRQLVPRLFSQNRPEETFWLLLPVFKLFYLFFSVIVAPVNAVLDKVRRPEMDEEPEEDEDEETIHEIQAFIDVGEEEGIIEESEGELIQTIIEFGDTRAGEVMRPRPQIVALEARRTVSDARRTMIESKYSRIPVYRDSIDNIVGIVYVRDLLTYLEPDKADMLVTECMRPAYSVPESKSIAVLLEEMQKAKVQMAMVIDEYGGVAGLVTVEDIIEEILGEIEDEDRAIITEEIIEVGDGSYLIAGSAEIRKVEMLYNKEVEADDFTTVAGLIINELGHMPVVGEKLEFKGLRFEVVEADTRRVNRVRLRPIEEVTPDEAEAPATSK